MSCLRIRTVLAALFAVAMLVTLAGCGGDSREHVRPHQERHPERYERHDDHRHDGDRHEERHDDRRHEERHDRDRHEDHEGHSDHH